MVGLGGTAEKLQKVASMAEDVYKRLNEMRRELNAMRQTVERVDDQTTQNRALLEAIAEQQGIDVDSVLARTAIEEAEPATEGATSTDDEPASGGDGGTTDGPAAGETTSGETTSSGTTSGETTSDETTDSGTADADGGTTDGSTTGSTDGS